MANHSDLDKSIDRSLDDFGRFLRHRWWLVVLLGLLIWWLFTNVVGVVSPPQPGTVLAYVLQIAFAILFAVIQFVAIFWFLGRPRIYWVMPGETGVGFDDYKGNPEVLEAARRIVILMRGVRGFKEMGGEISRGLLLVGPPGTGKSYLAQCISTEAGLPFAYASAASFRAMFIGMDVLMIKNLYRKARRLAREYGGCIIFLDEFDAIGMSRSSRNGGNMAMGGGMMGFMGGTGGLNELLLQMDPPPMNASWWKSILKVVGLYHGRNQREPVLTIGATNIPESLDPALLRPGRFDRKIIVAAPSDGGRREVIDFYLAKVKHDDMPIEKLVADTMGYTPVAIKHIINEAVVIAHFSGRDRITYRDVSEARETHEHGIRYPRALSLLEKRRLAYHEAGHAVASAKLMPRWRASYVTITKRLESGGEAFAARKPVEEIVTESADEVFATIQVCLASRAAEELFLHTRLNGVGGDLHTATQLALNYIVHWGMGDTFFSALATMAPQDVYTDPELRKDVEALLRKAYTDVKALIERHRAAVIAVAEALLVRDELHSDEIAELIRQSEGPRLAEIAATALGDGAAAPLEAVDAIANGFAAAPTGAPVEANGHAAVPADADLRPQGPVGAKGEGYDAPHREAQQRPEPPVAEQHNFFSAGI